MSRFTIDQEKKTRWRKILLWILFLFFSITLFLFFRHTLNRFRIQEVVCYVGLAPCDQDALMRANLIKGRYVWSNIKSITKDERVTVKRKWPDRILIQFPKRNVLVQVTTSDREKSVWVRDDGTVSTSSDDAIETIQVIDDPVANLPEGSSIDPWRLSLFTELHTIVAVFPYPNLQSIRVVSRSEVWWYIGDMVVLTRGDDIANQLRSLQYVFQTPTIDVHGKQVDLRFDQPVVRDVE